MAASRKYGEQLALYGMAPSRQYVLHITYYVLRITYYVLRITYLAPTRPNMRIDALELRITYYVLRITYYVFDPYEVQNVYRGT